MTRSIEKSLIVPLPPARAFALFTEEMDRWWPKDTHSLSAAHNRPADRVTVDLRRGGLITEHLAGGGTAPWATITDLDPGRLFAFDWYVGRTQAEATGVTVTFVAEGKGTRVTLTHSGFSVLGEKATETEANYRTGWDRVLADCYGGAARAA
jgi:uncharacterized protein YndB with AHSA1/START domain